MKLNVKDQNGVTLHTANKYCEEDIEVRIDTEELNILPSTEDQVNEGLYHKVSIPGSPDLLPENIAEGKEIFGVEGTAKTANFKITSGTYLFYHGNRSDYVNEILSMCEKITDASYMFFGCKNVTELDVSKLDTSLCTNMTYMFNDVQKVTNLNVSNFNTSNVTDMSSMFYRCQNLTELDLSNFDTSKVTKMNSMFSYSSGLKTLNVSNFNTSNVTDMNGLFSSCRHLTTVDLSSFDTTNVTNMNNLFYECNSLDSIDLTNFNTSNVTQITCLVYNCKILTELDLSSFDLSKATYLSNMFYGCEKLSTFRSFKNLGKGYTSKSNENSSYALSFSKCDLLTRESLLDVITNGLYDLNLTYDVANGGTLYRQKLIIGPTNIAKLTEEEIQIAIDKGWNVS